ncbi:MAG: hypothetical protein K2Y71_27365 [Xanthobacteraceae bacterium]|nr:hypothetical protein [Xanthobacteraceae bacterium]
MILSKLAGAALIVNVAAGPTVETDGNVRLSLQQKNAAVQVLMRTATECIARTVAADPRFRKQAPHAELGDIIVASVPRCVGQVRAMIDAYDRYFGDGSGEAFFMGPYLDALPAAVSTLAVDRAD